MSESGLSTGVWLLYVSCADDVYGLSEAHTKRPYVKDRRYSPRTIRNQCVGARVMLWSGLVQDTSIF